jgi:hypothetical protein
LDALGRLGFLLQKGVDAKGIDIGMLDCCVWRQRQRRAQPVAEQVGQAFDLCQKFLLAGMLPEPGAHRRQLEGQKTQPAQNEQAEPKDD